MSDPTRETFLEMTHHRFVNTTPNPSATKNNNGELVGPFPPLDAGELVPLGAADVVDGADDREDEVGVPPT